mgnify:FL=1
MWIGTLVWPARWPTERVGQLAELHLWLLQLGSSLPSFGYLQFWPGHTFKVIENKCLAKKPETNFLLVCRGTKKRWKWMYSWIPDWKHVHDNSDNFVGILYPGLHHDWLVCSSLVGNRQTSTWTGAFTGWKKGQQQKIRFKVRTRMKRLA